jgi:predicted enzyme related to lactoylglutathione lyase
MKNKVVLFEIPASDFKKAKQFYESVFDWKVELWGDEGAMALTTAADIDETLKAIEKAGGKVVTPKHPIDEWGFMADFADPEGNLLSLWEKPKKQASGPEVSR